MKTMTMRRTSYRGLLVVSLTAMVCLAAGPPVGPEQAGAGDPPDTDQSATRDEELSRRLIRRSVASADEGMLERIGRLMSTARENLLARFDPGPATQELQQTIVQELDVAIAAAAQRRSRRPSSSATGGDRRSGRKPPARREPARGDADRASVGPGAAADDDATTGRPTGALRETRRGWGHLPQRDREEIIQGQGEAMLERYRALIERYYRALAESDEP